MPRRKCSNVDATVGKRLKFYRLQTGLTQQQMSEALSIDRTTYTKYETGVSEPSAEIMGKIIKMLGVDYNAVFDPEKKPHEAEPVNIDELSAAESGKPPFMNMNMLNSEERSLVGGFRILSDDNRDKLQRLVTEMLKEQLSEEP